MTHMSLLIRMMSKSCPNDMRSGSVWFLFLYMPQATAKLPIISHTRYSTFGKTLEKLSHIREAIDNFRT
jgi:hypothetical protein